MEKNNPLKLEILSKEQSEQYCISSPKEIKSVMHYISEKGNHVALYYQKDNFILTTLLAVDDTGFWLEQSPSNLDNKCAAESNQLIFVSSHLQIKVQFTVNHLSRVMYHGSPAFYLTLPNHLYRLQRREYYRLITPAPLRCIIPENSSHNNKPREFIIMDVSCGGIGLTCMEADTELIPGQSFKNCQINLPELGMIRGTIEVKNLVSLTSRAGVTRKRAGCEFKNLDGPSIILLQRYVTNMQRIKY